MHGQHTPLGQPTWTRRLLPPDLAADLRHARQARGFTLRHAAALIGVSAGYLSRLERGLRAPRMAVAERWAAVLRVDGDLAGELRDAAVD